MYSTVGLPNARGLRIAPPSTGLKLSDTGPGSTTLLIYCGNVSTSNVCNRTLRWHHCNAVGGFPYRSVADTQCYMASWIGSCTASATAPLFHFLQDASDSLRFLGFGAHSECCHELRCSSKLQHPPDMVPPVNRAVVPLGRTVSRSPSPERLVSTPAACQDAYAGLARRKAYRVECP